MDDERWAELVIISEHITPEQINSMLGIKCDESWKIGDRRKGSTILYKNHGWLLKSRLHTNAPLIDHINDLLDRVSPYIEKINSISNEAEVRFGCVVYDYSTCNPPVYFDKEHINTISKMGATLDIDLYVLVGED